MPPALAGTLLVAAVFFAFSSIGGTVEAHPVPDGVIFRGIQVVVWSDRIEVRYQLGLSDNMVREELARSGVSADEIPEEEGAALRLYCDLMEPTLTQRMSVAIDDRAYELVPRRSDIVRQRHVQFELVYRLEYVATKQPAHFVLVDDNFQNVPGYHLAAIKARGEVEVVESNTYPVLSRLSRDPETPEDVAVLNTPVRRVEAMIAVPGVESPGPIVPSRADSTVVIGAGDDSDSPSASEEVEQLASSSEMTGDSSESPSPSPLTVILGGAMILVATGWIIAIFRRS